MPASRMRQAWGVANSGASQRAPQPRVVNHAALASEAPAANAARSFADDGLTFGTNHTSGLCVTFKERVPKVIGLRTTRPCG
mgnify:CR=1 FL=1